MPSSASSKTTSKEMFECLTTRIVDIEGVKVVGCDEIVVNTERNGGVSQQLEELQQKALQWLVCLFHAIEPPVSAFR